MKLMIASDIHGSAYYCKALIEAFHQEKAEKLLLLGDILYHGPRNDLPRDYNPKAVIEMLNSIKENILCIRGNCDTEVDQMVLAFPILADYCFLVLEGKSIYATHGHIFNQENLPPINKGDILLFGHTHIPYCSTGDYTFLNPGSVSIPKENSPHSYMLFTDKTFYWKSLNGDVYKSYNI